MVTPYSQQKTLCTAHTGWAKSYIELCYITKARNKKAKVLTAC